MVGGSGELPKYGELRISVEIEEFLPEGVREGEPVVEVGEEAGEMNWVEKLTYGSYMALGIEILGIFTTRKIF